MKFKFSLVYIALEIFCFMLLSFSYSRHPQDSSIIGTWVSEEDSSWRMVFTADSICFNYYGGTLDDSSAYSISNTSPQCGQTVPVENYTNYLQLTSLKNGDKTCYEINGITTHLSLRFLDRASPIVFVRQ